MHDKTKEKLKQIQELLAQKDAIEKKLEALISPERVVALPPDFSINIEILQLLRDAGSGGIAKDNILRSLKTKYPDYGIDRRKVASSLAYLKNSKKQIDLIGRGLYKAVDST